jgi:ERF superfamily
MTTPELGPVTKLLPALLAARAAFAPVLKTARNPHFNSRYADLASVLDACEPALAAQGLGVVQIPYWRDGAMLLVTTLAHTSGERLSGEYPILTDYAKPQQIGAALTYARRYSYLAIVGVAPEDDDGEAASGRGQAQPAAREYRRLDTSAPAAAPVGAAAGHGAAPANGHQNGHRGGDRGGAAPAQRSTPDTPKPGKALYEWLQQMGEQYEHDLVGHVIHWARSVKITGRIVDWPPNVVAQAYDEANHVLGELGTGGSEDYQQ